MNRFHFPLKVLELLGEMADSRSGAGNVYGEPGASFYARRKGSYQDKRGRVTRTQIQLEEAAMGQRRENLSISKANNCKGLNEVKLINIQGLIMTLKKVKTVKAKSPQTSMVNWNYGAQ